VFGSTAPGPVLGSIDEASAHRVVEDVGDRRLEVILVLDHPGGEALPQQRASPFVTRVVLTRVVAVEPVERAGEHRGRSLDDDVVVRSHDAIGVEREARPSDCPSEVEHEEDPIAVVTEEHRLWDRESRDVEEAGRQVGTADSSHLFGRYAPTAAGNTQRSTPFTDSTRLREPRRVSDTRRGPKGHHDELPG
jgi:hypothetical protein